MAGTSLDVPHSFEFTQSGDEHVCKVRVTMPDDAVQNFEATCTTKHAARVIAVFRASYAVRLARKMAYADPGGEDAPAPAPGGSGEASRTSSPESLGVESCHSESDNDPENMIVDTPVNHYSSSSEEGDDEDDDGLRVDRRRNTPHTSIAFVPALETSAKRTVDTEGGDALNTFDKKSSFGLSSLGDAKSQHVNEVLDAAPLQERFRECSEVEEGEQFEPFAQMLKDKVDNSRLTPRKRKDPPAQSENNCGRKAIRQPSHVPTSERRTRPFRSEPVSASRAHHLRKSNLRKQGSIQNPVSSASNLPSSSENVKHGHGEPLSPSESTKYHCDNGQEPQHQKRNVHNAELPVKNASFNRDNRIPRVPQRKSIETEVELDATRSNDYSFSHAYQHQAPPPGSLSHPPHPGQIHHPAPPFSGHSMFQGATHHPMNYASQYPASHMPPHPPHMSVPYHPPPPAPYSAPPPYIPQPGFPQPVIGHTIGPYPYQQPLPNGTAAFYHAHTPSPYPVQLHENQNAQREAEIRATAAEVAAKMAAEAAAKDAAKKAQSDFEADEKVKRARQAQEKAVNESDKKDRKRCGSPPINSIQELEKEASPVTGEQAKTDKRSSAENELAVCSIAENDGDQDDYVSKLHKMSQKGKMCTNLSSPTFIAVQEKNGSRSSQQCTMSVRFAPDPNKEGIVISKTVMASRKKTAKQLAAKEILAEIDKRLESQPQTSEEEVGSREQLPKSSPQKKTTGITTAVAALHRLYTLNTLCGPPIFKPEEPAGGGERGTWRSVVLLDVKDFGKQQYEDVGPSKKIAKQRCAFKAFEALKAMKVPGIESFTRISRDGKNPENKAMEQEDAAPITAIVDTSDDENGSNSSVDADLAEPDGRLLLPKDYEVLFPKNEFECEQWFKANSRPGSYLGLFVDSPRARAAFTTLAPKDLSKHTTDAQPMQPRFLCLSTAASGIVFRFPEPTVEGLESESTDDSDASLPEVVVETLENAEIKKCGFACEAGMSVLEDEEGFRAKAVDDVAIISLAITGTETATSGGPLASLPELTRHWLKKEVGQISVKGGWREKSDLPTKLREEGEAEMYTGVLASYACFCISQHMRHAARQKRTRTHGVAVAFLQLSEQVMSTAPT